jgi:hypothetical protein
MSFSRLAALALAVSALAGGAAVAHHSFAMFDMQKEVTLDGTIKEFRWTNPHSWIVITVKDAKGVEKDWNLEGLSPGALVRQGWKRSDIKVGDKAVVKANPLRDGSPGGSIVTVTIGGKTVGGSAGG